MNFAHFALIASLALVGCSSSSSSDEPSQEPDKILLGASVVTTLVEPSTHRVRYEISFFIDPKEPADLATVERVRIYSTDGKASGDGEKSCRVTITSQVPPAMAKLGQSPVPSFAIRILPDAEAPWQLVVGECAIPVAPTLGTNDVLKVVDLYGVRSDGGRWHATTSLDGKLPGR